MKNVVKIISIVAILACALCLFVACGDKDGTVDKYTISDTTVSVGDAYDSSSVEIVATLKNEKEYKVDENLKFVGDDAESLKLDDDGKFTQKGTYEVKVYAIEEREDLFIGIWKIIVE